MNRIICKTVAYSFLCVPFWAFLLGLYAIGGWEPIICLLQILGTGIGLFGIFALGAFLLARCERVK